MKALKYLSFAVIVICIVACSNGGGKITPTSKKINGPLGKFFEVVDRDYKISDNELSVEFKRIAEGGPTNVYSRPTFTVELQDEDGNVITIKSTSILGTDDDQLESVFSLGIDESASITFRFNKSDGTAKFKVSSTWDEDKEYEDEVDYDEVYEDEDDNDDEYEFEDDNDEEYEYDDDDNDVVNNNRKSNPEDWDALLKSYEEYVDKYITYFKTAANGDMTALSEYPALMEKAQEFSDKLQNAQGEMSVAQWNKYNKIIMKMAKAAQDLQ